MFVNGLSIPEGSALVNTYTGNKESGSDAGLDANKVDDAVAAIVVADGPIATVCVVDEVVIEVEVGFPKFGRRRCHPPPCQLLFLL